MKIRAEQVADTILNTSKYVRYVAIYRDSQLITRERCGISNASSSESDKYEELIVNPTLLKLVTQRGEIDCGGISFVLIRYGSFYQCIIPLAGGHISVGIEPESHPLSVLETIHPLIREFKI